MDKINKKLRHFDAFPKVDQQLQQTTKLGGLLTFVVTFLVMFLVYGECTNYFKVKQEYEFLVETQLNQNEMKVNVDLSVAMPCFFLNIDVHDASGHSIHVQNQIQLLPVHFDKGTAQIFKKDSNHLEEDIADMVYRAHQKPKADNLKNSKGEEQDACRIKGSFKVRKVAGNFHITPQGHGHGGLHTPHNAINFTHRIDKFSFGESYPRLVNPLDNSLNSVESPFDLFQYFLSIVPTVYIDNSDNALITNQYAVTHHRTRNEVGTAVPGIFFQYNIEALLVQVTERRPKLSQFLVRLCAIVGGLVACAGFLTKVLVQILPTVSKNQFLSGKPKRQSL